MKLNKVSQFQGRTRIKTVCKLQIGDKVRKILEKDIFEKGYTQNWSDQIFIITKVKQFDGICWYYLEDLEGNPLKGNETRTSWYHGTLVLQRNMTMAPWCCGIMVLRLS